MKPIDSKELLAAATTLKSGGLVAIPTETVYGLAGIISSESALKKIFALKGRPFFDPLIVHVSGIGQAKRLCSDWNRSVDFLARWFWPGPLSLIVKKNAAVSDLITSGLDTVALRWPSHPLTNDLLTLVGEPLAAPSANRFGRTSPSSADHVRQEFSTAELMILDGGPCSIGLESTVVSAVDPDHVEILRPGAVTLRDLEQAFGHLSQRPSIGIREQGRESPGHLQHHYMPDIPLVLVDEGLSMEDFSLLCAVRLGAKKKNVELILSEEAELAARELYAKMRKAAQSGADLIWIGLKPLGKVRLDLWAAIYDRLQKAATHDWRESQK